MQLLFTSKTIQKLHKLVYISQTTFLWPTVYKCDTFFDNRSLALYSDCSMLSIPIVVSLLQCISR